MSDLYIVGCGMTAPEFSANHAHDLDCMKRITIDYEAAVEASLEAQVAMPPLANRVRIVSNIVNAALGDTGDA